MKALVIYHGNCNDGFCAAWVAWRRFRDSAEYVPAQYGQEPPDCSGRIVRIVDFSYPREVLMKLKEQAEDLLVLDHHKTAEADLAALPYCRFDMNRSGASLAWDYFAMPEDIPGGNRPWIVNAVEDRDLWRWKYPYSKELNASITTWPRDFEYWEMQHQLVDGESYHVTQGGAVVRYIDQYTDEMCARAREVEFEGYKVPCVNVPYKGISEIVGKLAESAPFALGWAQEKSGDFVYSLRSRGDFDVSAIAKKYGGGGHKNSAGFVQKRLLF